MFARSELSGVGHPRMFARGELWGVTHPHMFASGSAARGMIFSILIIVDIWDPKLLLFRPEARDLADAEQDNDFSEAAVEMSG